MAILRWGIIGASGWAAHTFAPAIARARGNQLVAVLGSKRKSLKEFTQQHVLESAYTDLKSLLKHPGFDAVWIASPPDLHRAQAVVALRAGLHVLCEKPMATTVVDCRAMVRAAEAADRSLCIGFNNRAHPELQKLAAAVATGRFGDPLEVRAQMYFAYDTAPPKWRQQPRRSGGWAIGDIGTHLLDLISWVMNDTARAASGCLTNHCWGFKTDDHAAVSVDFRNGARGSITAATGAVGGAPRLDFYGSRGYFNLTGGLFGMPGSLEIGLRGKPVETRVIAEFDTYKTEVEMFARQTRGQQTSLATGEDGVANTRLVSAARGW